MNSIETHQTAETERAARRNSVPLTTTRELFRSEGIRGVTTRLLGRTVYRRVVVVATDLTKPPPEVESTVELEIREVTLDDVDAYVAFGPRADAGTMKRRLAAGSRCYAAWHEGRIVNAGWCDFGRANFDAIGAVTPIGSKDVYGRDTYTVPELRSRNIATVRMVTAMQQLREEGYERGLGFVLPGNRRGFGPTTKSGVDPIGSLGWFGLGPLRIYFFKRSGATTRLMPRFRRGRKSVELELDLS